MRGRLLVIGAAMLWGTTGTTQALGPAASPASVGAVRIGLGSLGLVVLAAHAGEFRTGRSIFAPGRRRALVVGAVAIAAYQLCFFAGVARAGVAIGTVVGIGSAPLFTGLLQRTVLRRPPEPRWGIATALGVAGSVLLVGLGGADVELAGVALALSAGMSYAVFTIASKSAIDSGLGSLATMAVAFAGGALLLAPVLLAADLAWVRSAPGTVAALWLGLGTVGVAYALFGRGLALLPAATVATLTLAEPLTAATLGVAVVGERPGVGAALGAVAIVAGLVVLSVRPRVSTCA